MLPPFGQHLVANGLTNWVFIPLNRVPSRDNEVREFQCRVAFAAIGVPCEPGSDGNGKRCCAGLHVSADGPFVGECTKGHGFVGHQGVINEHQPT